MRTDDEVAKMSGVSRDTVHKVERILELTAQHVGQFKRYFYKD